MYGLVIERIDEGIVVVIFGSGDRSFGFDYGVDIIYCSR